MSSEEEGVVTLLDNGEYKKSGYGMKVSMTNALRGGVIVDVQSPEQALVAERAGAMAVSVSDPTEPNRMADPSLVRNIKKSVQIPVISRVRVGHFVEAQVMEAVGVGFVDESETLYEADPVNFINKHNFRSPFICGCTDLASGLRRVAEGAAMLRTEGEVKDLDYLDVKLAVWQLRSILGEVRRLQAVEYDELYALAKENNAPYELLKLTKQVGRLPVPLFGAGGIATPADAAMLMQIGCDGVFISNIVAFNDNADDAEACIRGFVEAVRHYNDSQVLVRVCTTIADLNIRNDNASIQDDNAIIVDPQSQPLE